MKADKKHFVYFYNPIFLSDSNNNKSTAQCKVFEG